MSKYIRTEDKIYELYNKYSNGNYVVWTFDYDKYGSLVKKYLLLEECEIIAEADTIKELCDEFIVVPTARSVSYMKPKLWNFDFKKLVKDYVESKKLCDIYGAIWTNKSLKYVAKMNADGELVLI